MQCIAPVDHCWPSARLHMWRLPNRGCQSLPCAKQQVQSRAACLVCAAKLYTFAEHPPCIHPTPTLPSPCTHPASTPHTPSKQPSLTLHPPQSSKFNPHLLGWCVQAEVDFAADAGVAPSPQSAFVTCASSLTEGGQTSSHADDTRALMTAVLLGGISQDDLTVW